MAGTEKQREEINRKLVSMQMEMIGLTYQDAVDTPEFWRVYTLTTEQTLEWRKLALPLIKKTFKCNKRRAELTIRLSTNVEYQDALKRLTDISCRMRTIDEDYIYSSSSDYLI
jgi:hypothetical protein